MFESGFADGRVLVGDDFPGEDPRGNAAVVVAGSGGYGFVDTEFYGFWNELEVNGWLLACFFEFFEEMDSGLEVLRFVVLGEMRSKGPASG